MRLMLVMLGLAVVMAGCAGRDDMRSTASQSGAILNQAQRDAAAYGQAQTELDETIVANIASFNAMAAEGNEAMKSDQTIWVDSTMKGHFDSLKPLEPAAYLRSLDLAATPPEVVTPTVIDTSKVRLAVAKLNELAKERDLESQLAFIVQFAMGVKDAYDQAQQKAAGIATTAKANAKPLAATRP